MRRLERLLVDGLAVYRATRLVTSDSLTADVRERVLQLAYRRDGRKLAEPNPSRDKGETPHDDPAPPKLAVLVTCPWCVGFWFTIGAVVWRRSSPGSWGMFAEAAAISTLVGLTAEYVSK